jgi:hypothetical protein
MIRVLLVLGVLAAAVVGVWWFAQQPASLPPITLSNTAAQSAREKAEDIARAQAEARSTGRPVPVVETFSDSEMSSLANQVAADRQLPVDGIVLHATARGTIQGQARAHVGGQTLPVYLEGVPQVSGDQVRLRVTTTRLGALPLPAGLANQLTQDVRRDLELGEPVAGFSDLSVTATEGRVTVRGVATGA